MTELGHLIHERGYERHVSLSFTARRERGRKNHECVKLTDDQRQLK